jgi:hypothetical protein
VCRRLRIVEQEGTFHVHATRTRPPVEVSGDGVGVVSRAGSRLLADLADQTMLTAQLSAVFGHRTAAQTAHDPGRVLVDLAVVIADGGEAISDIATPGRSGCRVRPCGVGLDVLSGARLDPRHRPGRDRSSACRRS